MKKFDKMTMKFEENEVYKTLLSRGFEEDGGVLIRYFYSKNSLYCTKVSVSSCDINFYKEYDCGGMIDEFSLCFDKNRDIMEQIEDAFECFYFE